MPPVSVLLKPASSACNMNCKYCFYKDIACERTNYFEGMLSEESTENTVKKAMEFSSGYCSFMFQGGEPTLAGLDYYRNLLKIQKKYSKPGVKIYNSIQTNGTLIDDDWAGFLADNNFLVGLSLDGPAEIHNTNRIFTDKSGTFNKVMHAVRKFDKYNVQYNILSVVTSKNAASVEKIYNFFKRNNYRYLQFIPCLDPIGSARGTLNYSLSPENYKNYLIRIFRLWYKDLCSGEYFSIRHIDNYINILMGNSPEACSMCGKCSIQFVVEGNGNVYPCDFYVLDEKCIGNINEDSFAEMLSSDNAKKFINESLEIPEECKTCRYFALCRNGCKRDRLFDDDGYGKNYYCSAFKEFFDEYLNDMQYAARLLACNR